ncbi:testis-expressed protein 51 [Pseudophryne corroboree]|uniref:testis-expressed protein 51 n=1 Tax=Pseudophryne corroboree TaxID=495146 RepID=UPI003081BC4E
MNTTMWPRDSSVFSFVIYLAFIISANGCLLCSEEDRIYMKYDLQFMYHKYLTGKTNIKEVVEKTYHLFFNQELTKNNPKITFVDRAAIQKVNANIAVKIRLLLEKYKDIENSVFWEQLDDEKDDITRTFLNRSKAIPLLVCNRCEMESYEIVNCQTCQIYNMKCNDPIICERTNWILTVASIIGGIVLFLAIGGGFLYWKERKSQLDSISENELPQKEVNSEEAADDSAEEEADSAEEESQMPLLVEHRRKGI